MPSNTPVFSLRLIDILMMIEEMDKRTNDPHMDRITVYGRIIEFSRSTAGFTIARRLEIEHSVDGIYVFPFDMKALKRWTQMANNMTKSHYSSINIRVGFHLSSRDSYIFEARTEDLDIEPLTRWHNMHGTPSFEVLDLFGAVSFDPIHNQAIPLHKIIPHLNHNPNISRALNMNVHGYVNNPDWNGFSVSGLVGAYQVIPAP